MRDERPLERILEDHEKGTLDSMTVSRKPTKPARYRCATCQQENHAYATAARHAHEHKHARITLIMLPSTHEHQA